MFQEFLNAVADRKATVPVDHVYRFDEIIDAHRAMEDGAAAGKLVVTL